MQRTPRLRLRSESLRSFALGYFLPAPPGRQTEPPRSALTALTSKFPEQTGCSGPRDCVSIQKSGIIGAGSFGARAEVELRQGFFAADPRRWTQILPRVLRGLLDYIPTGLLSGQ